MNRACEIDDVLIQVLLFRPRTRIAELVKKASNFSVITETLIASNSTNNTPITASDGTSAKEMQSRQRTTSNSILEDELIRVLQTNTSPIKPSFPIANAVGRAAFGLASNVANNITRGAQHLLEATYENMEVDDYDEEHRNDSSDNNNVNV